MVKIKELFSEKELLFEDDTGMITIISINIDDKKLL